MNEMHKSPFGYPCVWQPWLISIIEDELDSGVPYGAPSSTRCVQEGVPAQGREGSGHVVAIWCFELEPRFQYTKKMHKNPWEKQNDIESGKADANITLASLQEQD